MPRRNQSVNPRDQHLSKMWDTLLDHDPADESAAGWESVEMIRLVHELDDAPGPDLSLIDSIWSEVASAEQMGATCDTSIASSNGAVKQNLFEAQMAPPTVGQTRRSRSTRLGVQRLVRVLAIAVLSGFVAGFVVIGGGARIAMRIAAMFAPDRLQGATTENFETVGEISTAGTINLLMNGGLAGISLGIVFMAIRAWLPEQGWRRGLATGLIFVAAGGAAVLENGRNPDYERFGIAGINICLFLALPFLFGFAIGPVVDWLDRRIGHDMPRLAWSIRVLVASTLLVLLVPLSLVGVGMLIGAQTPLALLVLLPLIAWIARKVTLESRGWLRFESASIVKFVGIGIPCFLGIMLTILAIGRIV